MRKIMKMIELSLYTFFTKTLSCLNFLYVANLSAQPQVPVDTAKMLIFLCKDLHGEQTNEF